MYLFERVIGQLLYLYLLTIFIFFIRISNLTKLKKILRFYKLSLVCMAYYFIPNYGTDLYRINLIVKQLQNMDIKQLYNLLVQSNTPLAYLYYYVIGKMNVIGLLPAVTAYIFYTNVFYIIYDFSNKNNIKMNNVALVLFYFMASGLFLEVISGIRSMLVVSFLARAMYEELINNKSFISQVHLYILSIFSHPIAISIFLVKTFLILLTKRKNYKKPLFNSIVIIVVLFIFFKYGNQYIISMFSVAKNYIGNNLYFYFWEFLKAIISSLLIIYILYYININLKHIKSKNENFDFWSKIYIQNIRAFLIVSFVLIIEYSTFTRLSSLNIILSLPLLLILLEHKQNGKYIKVTVFTMSFFILLLAISRGNLSSYKFFVLP